MFHMKTKRLYYDIEVYPNLLLISFKDYYTNERTRFTVWYDNDNPSDEINDIKDVFNFLNMNAEWLIGYNCFDYDDIIVKSLFLAEKNLSKASAKVICDHCYHLNCEIFELQRKKEPIPDSYRYRDFEKFYSYDLIKLFNTIDRVSLKQLAINLRWPKIQDLPIKPGTIIKKDDLPVVSDYCDNDVDILQAAFVYMTPTINERIRMTNDINIDVNNACDTELAKIVLGTTYEKITNIPFSVFSKKRTFYDKIPIDQCISKKIRFVTPHYNKLLGKMREKVIDPNRDDKSKKKKQFEFVHYSKYLSHTIGLGGIHSNNYSEVLNEDEDYEYWDIDVSSYYPRIITNDRLYPKHLGPIFVDMYDQEIVTKRIIAKHEGHKLVADRLKITANGTFGLTKSKFSWLYDPMVTTSTCVSGELYLLMLMEGLEYYSDCIVVYSNTDGMTVRVPKKQRSVFMRICKNWESYTQFELEYVRYKKMVIRDVNNYLMFTYDSKKPYKTKGVYQWDKPITKGYDCPVLAKAVYNHYAHGTAFEDYISKETDIFEFMTAERTDIDTFTVELHRMDKHLVEKVELQKNNRWIITNNNPYEGKIVKVHNDTGEIIEMQKGNKVTIVNNVDSLNVNDYKLDWNYYFYEAHNMAYMKPRARTWEVEKPLEQATLF